jgi:hypothetical protein
MRLATGMIEKAAQRKTRTGLSGMACSISRVIGIKIRSQFREGFRKLDILFGIIVLSFL